MSVKKMDKNGVEDLFPELKRPKGWWPVIPKDNADYYVLFQDDNPLCFVGIVKTGRESIEVQGLFANKRDENALAVFELVNWVGFHFMRYHIKIYVINDIAYWAWKKIGFKTIKTKKMKYWTAYWIEREAIT